ncbi:MAG: hypothetical protein IJL26_07410 [Clostridia bacterium]|nr:hypothetical protein [Clostridia bacterium]
MNDLIAYCGACKDYTNKKCPSCRATAWTEDDICMPVKCCREKGIEFCACCVYFLCPETAGFYEESDGHREACRRMSAMRETGQ